MWKLYPMAGSRSMLCSIITPRFYYGIRFYHRGGFLWAGGNESLNKEEFDEGVMYRYTIKIVQSSGNE